MKKLTKKERLVIYEKALEDYKCNDSDSGICRCMNQAMQQLYPKYADFLDKYYPASDMKVLIPDPFYHMDEFPEIWKRRPKDINKESGGYWFPTNDKDSRIRIFTEAIAEIKQSLNL